MKFKNPDFYEQREKKMNRIGIILLLIVVIALATLLTME